MLSRSAAIVGGTVSVFIAFFLGRLDANVSLYIYDALHHSPANLQSTFSDKTIWLTGASSGIGAELARQICHSMATDTQLILSARRKEKLDEVAQDCPPNTAGSITILPLDVTGNETEATIDRIVNDYGGIDVLVLNAGGFLELPALETSITQVRNMMELNLISNVRLATEVVKRGSWEVEGKGGHIVITSSLAGRLGTPVSSAYAASKHALHGYFASLRAELPSLRVDIICPGPVDTDIFESSSRPGDKKSIPLTIPGTLMSTQRTGRLILSSMMGPAFLFRESWIARGLSLLVTYLGQYMPHVYSILSVIMDPIIMKNYHEGEGFGFGFLNKLLS